MFNPSHTYLTVGLKVPAKVTPDNLAAVYVDWMNNYLTVANFAADYGLTERMAELTIAKGREIHNARATWVKEMEALNHLHTTFSDAS